MDSGAMAHGVTFCGRPRRISVVESSGMKSPNSVALRGLAALLTVILFAAAIWIVIFQNRVREPVRLAADVAGGSADVRQVIGDRLKIGRWIRGNLVATSGDGNADLTIPVYGSLGRGVLEEWAQEGAGKWRLCSLVFHSGKHNSITITVVDDASTRCDRE